MAEILTHRGLEPSRTGFYSESSYEAFKDHLTRGFGIEFDPTFLGDGSIAVAHDGSLSRITGGRDTRTFAELTAEDIRNITLPNGRLAMLGELLEMIQLSGSTVHALHLKGIFQEQRYADTLLTQLEAFPDALSRVVVFDARPEIAAYLKAQMPQLHIAPSVSHPHDIRRYNDSVHGTLLSVEQAKSYTDIYDWVWLDEWDLSDSGGAKRFYTEDTFETLREAGYRIALVTPELHGTSPGLLGGESHPDAGDRGHLFERIGEILQLRPDAVCTDYPEDIRKMID